MVAPSATADQKKSLRLVSSALETANSNETVKNTVSLIASTYVSSKAILPTTLASYVLAVENYVSAVDKEALVANLDGTVDNVVSFSEEVKAKAAEKKLTEFLADRVLSVAEDIVQVDEAKEDKTVATSSTRLASLSGTVSKRAMKKATEGLQHLNERTTAVVHVDLINYANEFIDNQVKPQVTFVAGLPSTVAEQFNTKVADAKVVASSASEKVKEGYTVVSNEFNQRVTFVANEVLAASKNESESVRFTLVVSALAQQARLAWNDFIIVPATAALSLPDLKPVTLYNAAIKSAQYQYLVSTYESSLQVVNAQVATVSAFPVSLYEKLLTESKERYVEFTGKEFSTETVVPTVVEAVKSRGYVAFLFAHDFVTVFASKSVTVIVPYLPAPVAKAVTDVIPVETVQETAVDN